MKLLISRVTPKADSYGRTDTCFMTSPHLKTTDEIKESILDFLEPIREFKVNSKITIEVLNDEVQDYIQTK